MLGIAQKIFGSVNERKVRPYKSIVQRINALEPVTEALSDDALRQRTKDFRQQVANGAKLDDILPRPSPRSARPQSVLWVCGISTSS